MLRTYAIVFLYIRNNAIVITMYVYYGTVQLQLHFYTRVHAWQHAVFRVCIA